MQKICFHSHSLADTDQLAVALAKAIPSGTCVCLDGPLGAGKTRLVQAIAAALGIDARAVVSPTFVLHQTYTGTKVLHHLDAYRLHSAEEFAELGPEEFIGGESLTFIEWADRVAAALPPARLQIVATPLGEHARLYEISASCASLADVLVEIEQSLKNARPQV